MTTYEPLDVILDKQKKKSIWSEPWALPNEPTEDDFRSMDEKRLDVVIDVLKKEDVRAIPMRTFHRHTFSKPIFIKHPDGPREALGIALKTLVDAGKLSVERGKRNGLVFRLLVKPSEI